MECGPGGMEETVLPADKQRLQPLPQQPGVCVVALPGCHRLAQLLMSQPGEALLGNALSATACLGSLLHQGRIPWSSLNSFSTASFLRMPPFGWIKHPHWKVGTDMQVEECCKTGDQYPFPWLVHQRSEV